jgi:hypothetical protein
MIVLVKGIKHKMLLLNQSRFQTNDFLVVPVVPSPPDIENLPVYIDF